MKITRPTPTNIEKGDYLLIADRVLQIRMVPIIERNENEIIASDYNNTARESYNEAVVIKRDTGEVYVGRNVFINANQ